MLVVKALDADGTKRTVEMGKPFTMGRGSDNDWVLVDPGREISKTHCRIEADGTGFILVDLSINGVTVDGHAAPMGPGGRHRLASGDIFTIGHHRFAVSIGSNAEETFASTATMAPSNVDSILEGGAEGLDDRASSGIPGEAEGWLAALPLGSADATLRRPMGWDEPPATNATILPLDAMPAASDFANRSEHAPAPTNALHVPQAQQAIPVDWMSAGDSVPPAASAAPSRPRQTADPDRRRSFLDSARLNGAALADLSDDIVFARCGEALRGLLDGLDAIEAAQAVAERDCGLPTPSDSGLWTDFFATNRDPLLALLVEPHPGPATMLAQRIAALADRQRALGHAVADAAAHYDARLAPEPIASEAVARFRFGPFAKAAAWTHFADLHAELATQNQGEPIPTFLVLLRKSFSRVMAKR